MNTCDPHYQLDRALLAREWEHAKGNLRALVAMHMTTAGRTGDHAKELDEMISAFIENVENVATW